MKANDAVSKVVEDKIPSSHKINLVMAAPPEQTSLKQTKQKQTIKKETEATTSDIFDLLWTFDHFTK